MNEPLVCWRCGATLEQVPLPLSRRAECPDCGAELHVCRMCRNFDPNLVDGCREDAAEPPGDKDRANFCDWFEPLPGAYQAGDTVKTEEARARLGALFGEAGEGVEVEPDAATAEDEKALAQKRLEALLGGESDED